MFRIRKPDVSGMVDVGSGGKGLVVSGPFTPEFLQAYRDMKKKPEFDGTAFRTVNDGGLVEMVGVLEKVGGEFNWTTSAKLLVAELRGKRDRLVELSRATKPSLGWVGFPGAYEYQVAGLEFIMEARKEGLGTLIADGPGSGKTLVSLMGIEATGSYPCLVLAPASVVGKWKLEVLGDPRWAKTGWLPHRGGEFTFMSYDTAWRRIEELKKTQWRGMIVDESVYCKGRSASRTKAALFLASGVRARGGLVLALNGTPMKNRVGELGPQLEMTGALQKGWGTEAALMREYGEEIRWVQPGVGGRGPARGFPKVKPAKASELVRLHADLRRYGMLRRERSEILGQLPGKIRTVVPIPKKGGGVNLAEYEREVGEVVEWMEQEEGAADFQYVARRNARFMVLRRLLGEAKTEWVVDWALDRLAEEEKLVVFGHHKAFIEGVVAGITTPRTGVETLSGDEVVKLDGGVTGEARHEVNMRFQHDDSVRVIVASAIAGGIGIDLTAAHTAVMSELLWSPADLEQAEARCDRSGQVHGVEIVYPLVEGTVDQRVWQVVGDKAVASSAVNDGVISGFIDENVGEEVEAWLRKK